MSVNGHFINEKIELIAIRVLLAGHVQGVGMRPAIARLAHELKINGRVWNSVNGVELTIQGTAENIDRFEELLPTRLPDQASVNRIEIYPAEIEPLDQFAIQLDQSPTINPHSDEQSGDPFNLPVGLSAKIPLDRVTCDTCRQELIDSSNRRFRYPYVSCTNCGPRYSIIRKLPYERADTSMDVFPLCEKCFSENENSEDRRFHCQNNACSDCGPRTWIRNEFDQHIANGSDAIHSAVEAIREGKVVALRGIGGYQLLVDATSDFAVMKLRKRKMRFGKPLAVLVKSTQDALRLALLSELEKQVLESPEGPIVITKRLRETELSDHVDEGLDTVGILLPTTPLHWLISEEAGIPLICTSGNGAGTPLTYRYADATSQLAGIADLWLEHDRPIERPIDDSVVRVIAERSVTIRLARGLAPLTIPVNSTTGMTALGGQQKSAIAISNGCQSIIAPHIGDLETNDTRDRFVEQKEGIESLFQSKPTHLVCDQHPDYFGHRYAYKHNRKHGMSIIEVQHHHAHIAAGMLEQGWDQESVLGVAFDGTGYGSDESVWGGEFLIATLKNYERVGRLLPFSMVGGNSAIKQPWRIVVPILAKVLSNKKELIARTKELGLETPLVEAILSACDKPGVSVDSSSVGRLFDAVAMLVLGIAECRFEGEAAMRLEAACDPDEPGKYDFAIQQNELLELDWRPVIVRILEDRDSGVPPSSMAMRFHRGLAEAVLRLANQFPELKVVLGGGVFQNRVLVESIAERFDGSSQALGLPGKIPVNDGGLAAGQLAVAAARLNEQSCESMGANPCA